jgi:hypothetical protein
MVEQAEIYTQNTESSAFVGEGSVMASVSDDGRLWWPAFCRLVVLGFLS